MAAVVQCSAACMPIFGYVFWWRLPWPPSRHACFVALTGTRSMTDRIDALSGIALVIAWFALLVTSLSGEAGQALAEGAPSPLMLFGMAGDPVLSGCAEHTLHALRLEPSDIWCGHYGDLPCSGWLRRSWRWRRHSGVAFSSSCCFSSLGVLRVAGQTSPMVRRGRAMLVPPAAGTPLFRAGRRLYIVLGRS